MGERREGGLKLLLKFVFPLWFILLLLCTPLVASVGVSSRETISQLIVPWASSAEVDGFIKPGEYADALEIDLSNATWEAYLYLKHDNDFLYVFIDHVSDTYNHPAGYDNGWVAMDTLCDKGDAPKEDDYLFHSGGHGIWIGDGPWQIPEGQWEELMGNGDTPRDFAPKLEPFLGGMYSASGVGAFGFSHNSLISHSIFEIRIPMRGWEFEEANWTVGFCVAAGSPGTYGDLLAKAVWPRIAYANYSADFYAGGVRTLDPLVLDPQIGSFPPPNTWRILTLADVEPSPEENITAPLAKVVPTPDGFISPGEWDDAEVALLGYSGFYGYLYVKHNWTHLWVHLDCPSDTIKSPLGWDNGWVAIDPDMSGGSEPQEYDMLFHSHGHLAFIGDGVDPIQGSQWGILRGHLPEDTPEKYWPLRDEILANFMGSGPAWGPTEASETPHSYWEFQIPLKILDLIPGLNITNMFGFCASMQDNDEQRIADWPGTKSTGNFWPGPDMPQGNYTPPESWGALTLAPESLSEEPELPPPPLPPPPLNIFDVLWDNKTFHVAMNSSSNVSDFYFSQTEKEIGFNVTGPYGTTGFCNVTIPIELLDGAFMVRINGINTFHMLTRNETHTSLYFVYSHSTQKVQIIGTIAIPEYLPYAQLMFLTTILVVALLERVVFNKRKSAHPKSARAGGADQKF